MAEKIKKLGLQRDYKKYLYFIDGEGTFARNRSLEKASRRCWCHTP